MVDNASRRGAVDLGLLLMFLAFAVIGGFMYWLMGQSRLQDELRLLEDTSEVSSADTSTASTVSGVDLQTDPAQFEGQNVRVGGLVVKSLFGSQGFWLGLPNGNPFLISMSEEVMAEGIILTLEQPAGVIGVLHVRTDSAVAVWAAAGTISEGDQIVAEFSTHFLEADQVVVAGGGGESGAGSGAGN